MPFRTAAPQDVPSLLSMGSCCRKTVTAATTEIPQGTSCPHVRAKATEDHGWTQGCLWMSRGHDVCGPSCWLPVSRARPVLGARREGGSWESQQCGWGQTGLASFSLGHSRRAHCIPEETLGTRVSPGLYF